MTKSSILAAAVLFALAGPVLPAHGQDTSSRYSMSPTDGGFARLDRETGEMSFCKRKPDGGWACEAMADGQQAMRREMDRLKRENEALRKREPSAAGPGRDENRERSASRDLPRYAPEYPDPPEGQGQIPLPTEDDVDKLFDYMEGMARKLKERMRKLEEQQGLGRGTPL